MRELCKTQRKTQMQRLINLNAEIAATKIRIKTLN